MVETPSNYNYGNNSIEARTEREAARQNPESVLGSKGVEGAQHTVKEIVANSLDEMDNGYGDKIVIRYDVKENRVSVRDFGRGVPLGFNEKHNAENWHLIFNKKDAGGKYGKDSQALLKAVTDWDNFDPKSVEYLYSIGLYGVGATATQYTSDYLKVVSYREGIATEMSFADGFPVLPDEWKNQEKFYLYKAPTYATSEPNGTLVEWSPSGNVFSDAHIGVDFLRELCESLSTTQGVHFELHYKEDDDWVFEDYLAGTPVSVTNDMAKSVGISNLSPVVVKDFTHGQTVEGANREFIYVAELELSYILVEERGRIRAFHNGMEMRGGNHFTALRNAMYDFFSSKIGSKLNVNDLTDLIISTVNTKSNTTTYNGLDKHSVNSEFIYTLVYNAVRNSLQEQLLMRNPMIEEAVNNIRERIEMREAYALRRKQVAEAKKATNSKKLSSKIVTSNNYDAKNYENSEAYLIEGDSASKQIVMQRNKETITVVPLVGKLINAQNNDIEKCLNNPVIKNLLQVHGSGVLIPDLIEESTYDPSATRFSDIYIVTDADKDGLHIRSLVMLFYYRFLPHMLHEGRVHLLLAPLYGVRYSDGSKGYLYSDAELQEFRKTNHKSVSSIIRFKGLGEMNSDDVANTLINVENRRTVTIQFDVTDPSIANLIEEMYGSSTSLRRKVIATMLGEDLDQVDKEIKEKAKEIERTVTNEQLDVDTFYI